MPLIGLYLKKREDCNAINRFISLQCGACTKSRPKFPLSSIVVVFCVPWFNVRIWPKRGICCYLQKVNKHWHGRKWWEKESNIVEGARS